MPRELARYTPQFTDWRRRIQLCKSNVTDIDNTAEVILGEMTVLLEDGNMGVPKEHIQKVLSKCGPKLRNDLKVKFQDLLKKK
jgi:hypothetical protein